MRLVRCLWALFLLLGLGVLPAPAQIELPKLVWVDDVPGGIWLRHDGGRGVGFDRGFTTLDHFFPLYQYGDLVFFNDSRFTFLDDTSLTQYDLGLGARYYSTTFDRVFGLTVFYDNFDSGAARYQQGSVAWEVLGDYFDVRGNLYFPEKNDPVELRDTFNFAGAVFQGNNVIVSREVVSQITQPGLDIEAGYMLPPLLETLETRAYLGYYHYQGRGENQIHGVRGRVEAHVLDTFSFFGQVQNDTVFDTTGSVGVAINLGGPRQVNGQIPLRDRRAIPIERNPVVVTRESSQVTQEAALDATTGQPLVVQHISSSAPSGGDGSFEHPFQSLDVLAARSRPRDILFVHAGSLLQLNSDLTLKDGQRLLGEGIPHFINVAQGQFVLPRATGGTTPPAISSAATIILARDNEVAGFTFNSAGVNPGITATGNVGFFNINRNTFMLFDNFPNAPVQLTNVQGSGVVGANTFSLSQEGIVLDQAGGTRLNLGIRNNTYLGFADAVFDADIGPGTLGLQFDGNRGGLLSPIDVAAGGVLIAEDTLGNNSPGVNISLAGGATFNTVPPGTLGLPPPP